MMALSPSIQVSAPETLPLSIAEAKAWMRISLPDDDALIAGLIRTGGDLCEAAIGQHLMARDVAETCAIDPLRWQKLSHGPVAAISLVEAIAPDGSAAAMAVADYQIDISASGDGRVRIVSPGAARQMRVHYRTGLAEDGNGLPESLRQGLLRLVAHLYAARDDARDNGVPGAVLTLWQPWRRVML